jgi:hypothetical protein
MWLADGGVLERRCYWRKQSCGLDDSDDSGKARGKDVSSLTGRRLAFETPKIEK